MGEIDGVVTQVLKQMPDHRGRVMHMVKADSPLFERFGEIYFSEILPGVVKAWKRHKKMTQLFAVPAGAIRLVIYDDRTESVTRGRLQVLELGRSNYLLVKVPPRLWYGFQGVSDGPALLANCADMPHDPAESESINPEQAEIPYTWPTCWPKK